jgi:hypothetical protein
VPGDIVDIQVFRKKKNYISLITLNTYIKQLLNLLFYVQLLYIHLLNIL